MIKKAQTKNSSPKPSKNQYLHQQLGSKPSPKPQTCKFNKSDIIWAKITGYPWWPAIVTTVPGDKEGWDQQGLKKTSRASQKFNSNSRGEYRVDFIADQTHAFLKKKFILSYSQHRAKLYQEGLEFSRRKRRYFQMAINEADQLFQVLELSKHQTSFPAQKNKDLSSVLSDSQPDHLESQSQMSSQQQNQSSSSQNLSPQIDKIDNLQSRRKGSLKKVKPSPQQNQNNQNLPNQIKINTVSETFESQKSEQVQTFTESMLKRQRISFNKRHEKMSFIKKKTIQRKASKRDQNLDKEQVVKPDQNQKEIFEENEQIIMQICVEEKAEALCTQQRIVNCGQKQGPINQEADFQQPNEALMNSLLQKYKLHRIDEFQTQLKGQLSKSNINPLSSTKIKGSKSVLFIKNIFSNFGRKKNLKKQYEKNQETILFNEVLMGFDKIKPSQEPQILHQNKIFLIHYCKKWTAKKIFSIVKFILKNHNANPIPQNFLKTILKSCSNISSLLFSQPCFPQHLQPNQPTQQNKKKISIKNQDVHFIITLKQKIQKCIKFLRFFSLQNWGLLSKIDSFSSQICLEVRSLQRILQNECGIVIKNEEKLEEIVKNIEIQNQKTEFTLGHIVTEMQPQNDSLISLDNKYTLKKQDQFQCMINRQKAQIELE